MNIKEIIEKYKIKPDLVKDQHFLCNEKIIKEIVKELKVNDNDIILEIGPGFGAITREIPDCKKIIAIEIDGNLAKILKKEIKKNNLKIIDENALKIIDEIKFTKLISALPYSICEPLFYNLFTLKFETAVLIVPISFYEKMKEKSNKLGLFADAFLKIKEIMKIGRDNFFPVPKVDSVALRITKKKDNFLLREFYLQRDKRVKNAIISIFIKYLSKTKRESKSLLKELALNQELENRLFATVSYQELYKLESILRPLFKTSK
jgi:16S rRNA (adenine1518-N6/adenine1519-N6)-dimethyltransferase